MAIKSKTPCWLDIFGPDATGKSELELAATSSARFVRSQDELGLWNPTAEGRVLTAKEALHLFGKERLMEVWHEGCAILPPNPAEPAKTLRERREQLGLAQADLARHLSMGMEIIAKAESPDYTSRINDLSRIAIALGLDDEVLGFQPKANGDEALAVRLKTWRHEGKRPHTVARLSEISWVIATQERLQKLITPYSNPLAGFVFNDNYGDADWPVWEVARYLAQQTRRLVGYSEIQPILSIRDLCHRLQIPLVHAELPQHIAGATLATGDARGVVVNVDGNDGNVWVQRATVAHELGHLLWDNQARLDSLIVDTRDQIENIVRDQTGRNYIEARANAFAVELLAPQDAVRRFTQFLDIRDYDAIARAVRDGMEHFGLSVTAMRDHLWNAYNREFDIDRLPFVEPSPSDEWMARERYTDDYYFGLSTPIERRGEFASVVVRAVEDKWISEETAAFYLDINVQKYRANSSEIERLFAD